MDESPWSVVELSHRHRTTYIRLPFSANHSNDAVILRVIEELYARSRDFDRRAITRRDIILQEEVVSKNRKNFDKRFYRSGGGFYISRNEDVLREIEEACLIYLLYSRGSKK